MQGIEAEKKTLEKKVNKNNDKKLKLKIERDPALSYVN